MTAPDTTTKQHNTPHNTQEKEKETINAEYTEEISETPLSTCMGYLLVFPRVGIRAGVPGVPTLLFSRVGEGVIGVEAAVVLLGSWVGVFSPPILTR